MRSHRIGVFYDGNFLLHASNYYNYIHPIKRRLSLSGLHRFILQRVAEEEQIDPMWCQITEAHYFRGRLNAAEAAQRGNQLYNDRVFDDILMSCRPDTKLCIAANITCEGEFIRTKCIRDWKGCRPDINKIPAIFLIYK